MHASAHLWLKSPAIFRDSLWKTREACEARSWSNAQNWLLICIHTLHYITFHYVTLHYITVHYITLHYIYIQYIVLHVHVHVQLQSITYMLCKTCDMHIISVKCIIYIYFYFSTCSYLLDLSVIISHKLPLYNRCNTSVLIHFHHKTCRSQTFRLVRVSAEPSAGITTSCLHPWRCTRDATLHTRW